ncbi:MAG: S8 family serine peptidase [Planctomycetes bacterium]|nr:S8 family serine peptidase [Planctomycetota bacterium]
MRWQGSAALVLAVACGGADLASAQGEAPSAASATARCDTALLADDGPHPIFVRFRSQLFATGQDFERYVAEHATTKRSKLRTAALEALQQNAARAAQELAPLTSELERADALRETERFWIVNGLAATATKRAVEQLAAHPAVAYVHLQTQPGRKLHVRGERTPRWIEERRRDLERALAQRQEMPPAAFDPQGLEIPWNLMRIGADRAWASGAHGAGVVIALLDSGVLPLPALTRALWQNPGEKANGADDDGNGLIDDLFGWDFIGDSPYVIGESGSSHGTMCGGILAGREDGEPRTITGVAPRASLLVLRGMGDLRAYEYAARAGADVLSMSYMWAEVELGSFRGVYRTAHEHLAACGIVAVGGAGNYARTAPAGRQICLPKDIPIVIAAAGIDASGKAPAFSSRGPCTWSDVPFFHDYPPASPLAKPDVTGCNAGFPVWNRASNARGRRFELLWDAGDGLGLVRGAQGNSFAGPHAGGVAALLLSAQPELTPWRVKQLMEATCEDLGEAGRDLIHGAGLLRADRAVAAAREAALR